MKIETLSDLVKVIRTCRKLGVESIKIDTVEIFLGQLPDKPITRARNPSANGLISQSISPGGINEQTQVLNEELTEEQLLFYSSRPEAFTSEEAN